MSHAKFILTTKSKQTKFTHMIALNSTEFVREFKSKFEIEPLTLIPVFSGIILVYYTDNEISETKQAATGDVEEELILDISSSYSRINSLL